MTIQSQMTLRQNLTRVLTETECDNNNILLAQALDAILAGTVGYEAGNALKLGGQTPIQLLAAAGRNTPALTNSYTNFGGGFSDASYRKSAIGEVVLEGLLVPGTNGQSCFTLPAGYRPLTYKNFPMATSNGFAYIGVYPTGGVFVNYTAGATWVSLEGVRFATD